MDIEIFLLPGVSPLTDPPLQDCGFLPASWLGAWASRLTTLPSSVEGNVKAGDVDVVEQLRRVRGALAVIIFIDDTEDTVHCVGICSETNKTQSQLYQ